MATGQSAQNRSLTPEGDWDRSVDAVALANPRQIWVRACDSLLDPNILPEMRSLEWNSLWHQIEGDPVVRISDPNEDIERLLFSPDGQRIAVESGKVLYVHQFQSTNVRPGVVRSQHISSLAWSPDGNRLASGDKSGEIRVWQMNTPPMEWDSASGRIHFGRLSDVKPLAALEHPELRQRNSEHRIQRLAYNPVLKDPYAMTDGGILARWRMAPVEPE